MPHNIVVKKSNGQYVKLAKLANNCSAPDDETLHFSVRNGDFAMSQKSKVTPVTALMLDISFTVCDLPYDLSYASTYVIAHPKLATVFFLCI